MRRGRVITKVRIAGREAYGSAALPSLEVKALSRQPLSGRRTAYQSMRRVTAAPGLACISRIVGRQVVGLAVRRVEILSFGGCASR
jgi:hypothetical protein